MSKPIRCALAKLLLDLPEYSEEGGGKLREREVCDISSSRVGTGKFLSVLIAGCGNESHCLGTFTCQARLTVLFVVLPRHTSGR